MQYSDCGSLTVMAALRHALWTEDDERTCLAYSPNGDELRWIPTHLQVADALTKSLKQLLINAAPELSTVIVREP